MKNEHILPKSNNIWTTKKLRKGTMRYTLVEFRHTYRLIIFIHRINRSDKIGKESTEMLGNAIRILDVGSCFNPLRKMLDEKEGPAFAIPVEVCLMFFEKY